MKDAWKQKHDLLDKYTITTDVRNDLRVMALACDRNVVVAIAKVDYTKATFEKGYLAWQSSGPRNVSTMREFANAILEACDFVDASNPTWAAGVPE